MQQQQAQDFYVLSAHNPCGYTQFCFGAGENHLRLTNRPAEDLRLLFHYHGDASVLQLLLLIDALKRAGAVNIDLLMPYFPGGRQDRVCQFGEALSAKVYAELMNAQKLRSVTVFDAHSDVTAALLDRVKVVKNHAFVQRVLDQIPGEITLIAPDAGANKKIFDLAAALGGLPVVRADKIRDVRDGKIISTEVFAQNLEGQTCVIVDDICSGGRTFIELAKKLKEKGAEKVILVVSHYEGRADEQRLKSSGIDQVFCTNSLHCESSELVSVQAILPFILSQGEVS